MIKIHTIYHTSVGITIYGTQKKANKIILIKNSFQQLPLSQIQNTTIPKYVIENLSNKELNDLNNANVKIGTLIYTSNEEVDLSIMKGKIQTSKKVSSIPSVKQIQKKSLYDTPPKQWDEIIITKESKILTRHHIPKNISNTTNYCSMFENQSFLRKEISIEVPSILWDKISSLRCLTLLDTPLTKELIDVLTQRKIHPSLIEIKGPIEFANWQNLPVDVLYIENNVIPSSFILPKNLRSLWASNTDLRQIQEIELETLLNIENAKIPNGFKINFKAPGRLIIDGDNLKKIASVSNLSVLIVRGGKVDDNDLKILKNGKNIHIIFEGVNMQDIRSTYFLKPNVKSITITDLTKPQIIRTKMPANIDYLTSSVLRYPGIFTENIIPIWKILCDRKKRSL